MISGGEPGPAVPERKPGCRAGPRRRHRWPAREPSTAATHGVDPAELRAALDNMEGGELPPPVVAEEAVQGLKYRPGAARQLRPRPQSRRPRSTGPCRAGHRRRRRTRSRQLGSRSLAHRPERRITDLRTSASEWPTAQGRAERRFRVPGQLRAPTSCDTPAAAEAVPRRLVRVRPLSQGSGLTVVRRAGPAAGVQRDSRQSGHLVRCPSTGAAPAVTAARDAFGCDNQAGRHVVTGQRDRTGGRNRTVPVCVPARPRR